MDRSFVSGLRAGTKEAMTVCDIVHLGNSLGKRVIAEGIETPSQFAQLREMGCHEGQGFHMSRPLAPHAVEALLTRALADHTLPIRHLAAAHPAALIH